MRSLATPFWAQTTAMPGGAAAASASTAVAVSCDFMARMTVSSGVRASSAGEAAAGMGSISVPAALVKARPRSRRAARWAPRAISATSWPVRWRRAPMTPPMAPAP